MAERPLPLRRADFALFRTITTRWMDNDVYGHINNVQYYSFFDTVVNGYLVEQGALDPARSEMIGLVVETQCNFFAPLSFPQAIEAGLRVTHLGNSSVRYEIGIFAQGEDGAAAQGHFVHVYVDRASRRPVGLPQAMIKVLAPLLRTE
jgi:acyl-CoA thioester hydrolase